MFILYIFFEVRFSRVLFHRELLCQCYIYETPLVLGLFVFLVYNRYPEGHKHYMMQNLTCALFSFSTPECRCPARRGYLADFVWSRRILGTIFSTFLHVRRVLLSLKRNALSTVDTSVASAPVYKKRPSDMDRVSAGLWLGTPCSIFSLSPITTGLDKSVESVM